MDLKRKCAVTSTALIAAVTSPPGRPLRLRAVTQPSADDPQAMPDWNATALATVLAGGANQAEAAIYVGLTQATVYDAVIAIEKGFQPYLIVPDVLPGSSPEPAAVAAAYGVLATYFPAQKLGNRCSLDVRLVEPRCFASVRRGRARAGRAMGHPPGVVDRSRLHDRRPRLHTGGMGRVHARSAASAHLHRELTGNTSAELQPHRSQPGRAPLASHLSAGSGHEHTLGHEP
jgi:hypothetical protein